MGITPDQLLVWLEEKINEGALIELGKNRSSYSVTLLKFNTIVRKHFVGPTLIASIKQAWEMEQCQPVNAQPKK